MPKKQINEEELAEAIRKISPEMPQRFADRMEQTLQKIVEEEAKINCPHSSKKRALRDITYFADAWIPEE